MAADYSATPLAKKLGAKPGAGVVVFFTTTREEPSAKSIVPTACAVSVWRAGTWS